ncbi:putative UbiX-like flavin prenyltransferase [Sporomusa rhizae]|uniref:UbiX family flavin prenyltransferase n=1 Tax=Sporomusa rhizae TaxID=357999 RepID=UPI00352A91CF
MKPIVGITNATGMAYAVHLLEEFNKRNAKTRLIMSRDAESTLLRETNKTLAAVKQLVSHFYFADEQMTPEVMETADSMVIVPCSVEAIAAMVQSPPQNSLQNAAAFTLESKKKLILVTSEPRLGIKQLEVLLHMAHKGAVIMPYMPSFYHRPATINDIVAHHTGRIFDLLDIEHNMVKRWGTNGTN